MSCGAAERSTPIEFVSRLTEQDVTPGTLLTAFSPRAAQAAQLEGVVPGGGTALVRLIPTIKSCADALRGDEKTGALAVIHALEAPVWQIAENAGRDGSTIAAKLRSLPEAIGYDAGADRFTDMVQAGILDPVRVTRTALQSALSVSASMLTTEACITGNDQSTEA